MSRIGKMPVVVPQGVTISFDERMLTVTGAKGTLQRSVEPEVSIEVEDGVAKAVVAMQTKRSAALWGLYRALLANMVQGVSQGYSKQLEMAGVGHRAAMQGSNLNLSVGFSHPVIITPPAGISFVVNDNTKITVSGIDKELVGEIAAKIRAIKPPEPYKGKGIHYMGEVIRRKAGKAAKAVGGK